MAGTTQTSPDQLKKRIAEWKSLIYDVEGEDKTTNWDAIEYNWNKATDELLAKLSKENATTNYSIAVELSSNESIRRKLYEDMPTTSLDQKRMIQTLVWCEVLDRAMKLLLEMGVNDNEKDWRKALHRVLLEGMRHFLDLKKHEFPEKADEYKQWMEKLKDRSWYIDLSLVNEHDERTTDMAIVKLLMARTQQRKLPESASGQEARGKETSDSLREWVQCLHERKYAPLFVADGSAASASDSGENAASNFCSKTDDAGNTVLMLAAQAGSVSTFEYVYNHPENCEVPSCKVVPFLKKDEENRRLFQLTLLEEKNSFNENVLHAIFKLADLHVLKGLASGMHIDLLLKSKKHEQRVADLVTSRNFFKKNILHQLFSKCLDESEDQTNKDKANSDEKQDKRHTDKLKSSNTSESIIKLIHDWINQLHDCWKQLHRRWMQMDEQMDVRALVVMRMLNEEDSADNNVLMTAVRNNNVSSISWIGELLGGFEMTNGKKKLLLKKLLRNTKNIDIIHVCAAYGNLANIHKIASNIYKGLQVHLDKQGSVNSTDEDTCYGGPVGSGKSQNTEQNTEDGQLETQEGESKATGKGSVPTSDKDMEDYLFGAPIRPPSVAQGQKKAAETQAASSELAGWNVMHFACRHGNAGNIERLIINGYRTDELNCQGKTAGELAADAGYHVELKNALRAAYGNHWLPKYVSSVDPIASAFEYISQTEAHRTLKARDPEIRAELQFVASHSHLLDQPTATGENGKMDRKRLRHYFHCLTSGESVESYLYLCLQLDSAELYRCLINSTYWQEAIKTMSIEEIEDSTVRYIMGKRDFEDQIYAKERADSEAKTHLQATTVSARLEQTDFVELTIPEDHDNEINCCNCCMLPLCCNKCRKTCGCIGEGTKGKMGILKYRKNGVIFLSYMRKKSDILQQYDLMGLALLTGRVEMVKCLLMTRQYDLIPKALQIIVQTDKLIACDEARTNPYLLEVKDFATHVVLNAVNCLYNGTNRDESELIFQYLLGQLPVVTESGDDKRQGSLTLKRSGQHMPEFQYYTGQYYKSPVKSNKNSPSHTDDCDIREASVDFYARSVGYWPDDASRQCELNATGPYFQHHLKNGKKFRMKEDRRAIKCLILERNSLPMYNIVDLARKSRVKILFSTSCMQDLSEKLWKQPVAVVARKPSEQEDKQEVRRTSCSTSKNNWRLMFCPLGLYISHLLTYLFYLAIFMKYVLSANYRFGWEHIIISTYIASFFVQELYEAFDQINTMGNGITSYLKSIWNMYDWLLISFTLAGLVLVASIGFDLGRYELTTEADKDAFLNNGNTILTVYNSKMVLGFGFVFSTVKLLSALRYIRETGSSLAIMHYVFFRDLLPFCLIMAVMIGAFGTYFYAMLTVGGFEFYSNLTYHQDREKLTLVEVYTRPLLAVFGHFDLENLRRCKESRLNGDFGQSCVFERGSNTYIYCGIFFFVIIVNLIMINMLIAKFSSTVASKEKRSMIDWMFNRFEILAECRTASILPPPFNLLYYGPLAISYLCRTARSNADTNSTNNNNGDKDKPNTNNSKTDTQPVSNNEDSGAVSDRGGDPSKASAAGSRQTSRSASVPDIKMTPFEHYFVLQAEKIGRQRMQLYRKRILVYHDEDSNEEVMPCAANIDFNKPGYQEDETIDQTTDLERYSNSATRYRLKSARPATPMRSKSMIHAAAASSQ